MSDYFYGFTLAMYIAIDPYGMDSYDYDLLGRLVECIQDEDNQ